MRPIVNALVALALGGALSGAAAASEIPTSHQHDHGSAPLRLGSVHFATSCSPSVQAEFDRGVALLHSFWFSAAIESFNSVLQKDPECVIAHWGIAMSWWGNPFAGFRSPQALAAGLAAVDAAKASSGGTDRERTYLSAVELLYRDSSRIDQRSRTVAYEKAMEALAAKFPDDSEARIFYALALNQTALLTDKTYANQLKAAAILEAEYKLQPNHPGAAHYIVHSFDVAVLAPRALDAARHYAAIAPDAAHALHMPSHTFTRVGSWQESIDTNLASAAAARKDGAAAEELHALDYQAYAYLQTGQDNAAKRNLDAIAALGTKIGAAGPSNAAPPQAGYFALAAIPARYALEREAWEEAAKLQATPSPFVSADAITHFARAVGAAHSGALASASADIERLVELRDKLRTSKDEFWAGQVEVQRLAASALVQFYSGNRDAALSTAREAATLEDASEKSAMSPGPIKPAREILGELLLGMNRPKDALMEFEAALKREPNRFRSTYGAAQSALAAGDRKTAELYAKKLLQICERADPSGRNELVNARKMLGQAGL